MKWHIFEWWEKEFTHERHGLSYIKFPFAVKIIQCGFEARHKRHGLCAKGDARCKHTNIKALSVSYAHVQ